MVSAFFFLVPLAPYAVLRLAEPAARPLPITAQSAAEAPLHPATSGAPDRPDAGGPISPLSDRAALAAARGWEWKNLESPGWKLLKSDSFVLRGDVPIDDLRVAGACLEEFLKCARETLGGDPAGLMFSIRVFENPRDFRIYAMLAGAPNAESFYDPRSAEVVLCLDRSRGRSGLHRTLAHEFAHEYMDRVWNRTGPPWFAEGTAEYLANFSVREGRVRAGGVDRAALALLRTHPRVPLRRFLRLGRADFYGESFPQLYAQAWALVHFLFARNDGTIDLLLRGKEVAEDKVETLEKDFEVYVGKLQ